jgi:hypothetical protein
LVRTMPALALLPPSCLQLGELDATSHSHTQRQHMLTVTYGLKGCPAIAQSIITAPSACVCSMLLHIGRCTVDEHCMCCADCCADPVKGAPSKDLKAWRDSPRLALLNLKYDAMPAGKIKIH